MGRRARSWTMAALVAALAIPVIVDADSFPLSTYPMYARTRGTVVTFATATGVDSQGNRATLSLELIGRSDDPLIVAGELRSAIRRGDAAVSCDAIASRVADASSLTDIEWVEVVGERHDTVEATLGRASLIDRVVHARCPVPGPAA